MTRDEISQLIRRVVAGEANLEEIRKYNQLFNSFQPDKSDLNDFAESKQMIHDEIKAGITEKIAKKTETGWLNPYRLAAAAVFFGLVSLTIFLLQSPKQKLQIAKTPAQKLRFKNDVAPGRDGAILTLAGGQTIVLDSAGNGILASQSSTEIVKRNGQIVYENKESSSEILFNTMSTPKGRQYSLVLSDGTKVWLNSASSITFPTAFSGAERKVSITGEAYFEV